jgi:YOP proteins translocation protein K (YscK)
MQAPLAHAADLDPQMPLTRASDIAASARRDAQLVMQLVEFNLHVARIAHPSWLPPGLRRVVYNGQGVLKPEAERSLSDWLLDEHDLRRHMDWQMHEPEKRLWLLDGASLSRLAVELSVLLHREWLVRVIDGAYLRKLSAQVDPALLRSLADSVPRDAPCHSVPQVSFTAAAADDVGAKLHADGMRVLLSLLNPFWRAVCGRARLRLDVRLATIWTGSEHSPPIASAQAPGGVRPMDVPSRASAHGSALSVGGACESLTSFICSWLISRRFPQWAWLF